MVYLKLFGTLIPVLLFKSLSTVKSVLTTTSEQRPPVNNNQPESPTPSYDDNKILHPSLSNDHVLNKSHFLGSQGFALYSGLTVHSSLI
jgi:hypothetical protein